MIPPVDLYNNSYSQYEEQTYKEVRQEIYDTDLGQSSWMTAEEFHSFFSLLELTSQSHVLEVGCGAGGCAIHLAATVGATVTGIDINKNGIGNARKLALSSDVDSLVRFEHVDAVRALPFADDSFDAIYSNDSICHMPNRLSVLTEWRRVLKPGGRLLFTDAMILTGALSNEEIATRSSIGLYVFLPPGENERVITDAGLQLLLTKDSTEAAEQIAGRWFHARESRRQKLISIETEDNFLGVQKFLSCVYKVSLERRLSRFLYLAMKRQD
jgi:ubiquinone/menaquinone biosynthesis C-methylase UbiE